MDSGILRSSTMIDELMYSPMRLNTTTPSLNLIYWFENLDTARLNQPLKIWSKCPKLLTRKHIFETLGTRIIYCIYYTET